KAVKDKNNKIIYYDGTFEDISRSKEAEQKLQSSEARMRYILNATTTIIYSIKVSGDKIQPVWVGDNISQFGYKPEELLDEKWWLSNVHPEDVQKIQSLINQIKSSRHIVMEYRFKNKQFMQGRELDLKEAVAYRDRLYLDLIKKALFNI
ncbi:MAG: PAS domain-containing protein, partial [Calditrichaceae bacterium]